MYIFMNVCVSIYTSFRMCARGIIRMRYAHNKHRCIRVHEMCTYVAHVRVCTYVACVLAYACAHVYLCKSI